MRKLIDSTLKYGTLRFHINEVKVQGHLTIDIRRVRISHVTFDYVILDGNSFLAVEGLSALRA